MMGFDLLVSWWDMMLIGAVVFICRKAYILGFDKGMERADDESVGSRNSREISDLKKRMNEFE